MQRIAASDYRDIVQVSEPDVSPADDRIAFIRKTPRHDRDYTATVYTVPVGDGNPQRLTVTEGTDTAPRFSPSGDRLAFVSTRGADDDSQEDLWVQPVEGGDARQLTATAGDVKAPSWSPDGRFIVFQQRSSPAERNAAYDLSRSSEGDEDDYERQPPDPRVIDRMVYRSEEEYFDGTRNHVYTVDTRTGDVKRLTDGEFDYVTPVWGDATTVYYAVKRGSDPDDSIEYDIVAHDVEAGTSATITTTTTWLMELAATADGRLAYPYVPPKRGTLGSTEIHLYDPDADERRDLTAGIDRTVDPELGLEWDPAERALYFVTPDQGTMALRKVDSDGQTVETVVDEGHLDGFSVGESLVGFTRSDWDHPGDVFVARPTGGESDRLTRVNEDYLDERAVLRPEEIWFESDGVEVQGWLLTPPDAESGDPVPLVVEVHGGPHAMWSTSGTMWHEFQTLAARGYAVFWSNPRGSTGYGEAHRAAIEGNWGQVTMTDVVAGIDRVSERAAVDDDAVFLTGGSFGGFMAGWMVGHTDRFRAAVAQRGVYDLVGFYGATDHAFKLVEWDFGTTPLEDPAFLWEQSPVAHAGDVSTPILLMHSENDYRVAINDAELFYRLLRKRGIDVRLVRYPRDGHELSRSGEPAHVVDRLERIGRWFDGYSPSHDAEPVAKEGV